MGKIKKILENELVGGTQTTDVYPVTSVKAVYDENNERLDNIINRRGVVNISTNYNSDHIAEVLTLDQAIAKVPSKDRVLGFQGKFLTENGWEYYIFTGESISNWNDKSKWDKYYTKKEIDTHQQSQDKGISDISSNAYKKWFTDNEFVNGAFTRLMLQRDYSTITLVIGSLDDINIILDDGAEHYYRTPFPEKIEIASTSGKNIMYLDVNYLNKIAVDRPKGSQVITETGNILEKSYTEDYLYSNNTIKDKSLDKNKISENFFARTINGNKYITDNPIINSIITECYISNQTIDSLHVVIGTKKDIKFDFYQGDNKLFERYLANDRITDVIEIYNAASNTSSLISINKNMLDVITGVVTFEGNIVDSSVYSESLKHFPIQYYAYGNMKTDSGVGGNIIWGSERYFLARVHITEITILAKDNGVVDLYALNKDTSINAKMIASLYAKKGLHTYKVDFILDKNEALGSMSTITTASANPDGYKLLNYNKDTTFNNISSSNIVSINIGIKYKFLENKISTMQGVTFAVLSDSIGTFDGYAYSNPYYPRFDIYNYYQTWWGRLIVDGMILTKNQSVSQSTVTNVSQEEYKYRWIGYADRIEHLYDDDGNEPNIIFLPIGVNDMFGTTIGDFDLTKKIDQYSKLDTYKFKQAYQYVIYRLLELYPHAKIYVCTPFPTGNTSWGFPEFNSGKGFYFKDLLTAIREVSDYFGVGIIDFYKETEINYLTMKNLEYKDAIHGGNEFHYKMYKIVRSNILKYLGL